MRHNAEDETDGYSHEPVLWREVIDYVDQSPVGGKGMMVDATLGEGGHSEVLLDTFPELTIVAFERDTQILDVARARLKKFGERITFVNQNFSSMPEHLKEREGDVSHILFDFGISSFHYEKSGRGFSYGKDERLDMRLDGGAGRDAHEIINRAREKDLADIFYRYGEERWSRRIAAAVCREREKAPIESTVRLAELVLRAIPRKYHVRNIHPATRVFQALRIVVNDELAAVETVMEKSYRLLRRGGRIMAISFHSLEDRIVKDYFRRLSRGCTCRQDVKYCQCTGDPFIKILTKRPLMASMDELEKNSRARSAKLRACERL